MNVFDILDKKRKAKELNHEEIKYFFSDENVKDYQLSAMLMAICINGMSIKEIISLTKVFIESGVEIDLTDIEGIKIDKHSSGGVGDKVSLILMPLLASLGIKSCKMSGRSLGLTGGTIDKLESIPGMKLNLSIEDMKREVKEIGMVIASQTEDLVPLDKKIYALRDVTATVESIPLIASSIMSKKIASGADDIFIDLKYGSGAFMKSKKEAIYLARVMEEIGVYFGKAVFVELSNMNQPLGRCIGNKLEVLEAKLILEGKTHSNLTKLISKMAIDILTKTYKVDNLTAEIMLKEAIKSKRALNKFKEFIAYQKGKLDELKIIANVVELKSIKAGIIDNIDAEKIAILVKELGAGRDKYDDVIDYNVGIALSKLSGETVKEGDVLAKIYYNKEYPNLKLAFEAFEIK